MRSRRVKQTRFARAKFCVLDQNARVKELHKVVEYANAYLRISEIGDYPNAWNGLQVENGGSVHKIAAAVDCSTRALEAAAASGANFLLVHHGIFWGGVRPITGAFRRQLKLAFDHDIAVYSAHLPLDLHADIGNNVLLTRALGIHSSEPFFEEKGLRLGQLARTEIDLAELTCRLERAVGAPVKKFAFGPRVAKSIGIITGGAGGEIEGTAREGVDTFITGEAPHWAAIAAEELGINLLLAGHYATETFGVKALASHLEGKFQLPWEFIDLPTGL